MKTEEYVQMIKEEGIVKYFVFPKINRLKNEFTEWYFKQKFVSDSKNSLSKADPDFINYSRKLLNEAGGGACYLNAQRILKLDGKYYYNEGFYSATWTPENNVMSYPIQTEIELHAFNSLEMEIMDFESTLKPSVISSNYYGIQIPNEKVENLLIIKNDGANILEIRSTTSLVIPFFLISTNREGWLKSDSSYFIPADCING